MAAVTSAATAAAARIGAALSDAQYFESSMVRVEDIRRQLDSRSTKDKLDAMKRVIALISLGKDASTFFPDVVKNVVASSIDVKKLVYLYLVHYAEHKQDLALLAINSFQKDLSDTNQHIRALSLRVLSSIRVKVILQVVILAINNASKDSSAYVRKAAAYAIGKVCALDTASKELLLEPLEALISDRSTQVMGSAIAAYDDVCPNNWSLIHPHFRRICNSLAEIEPWGQITIINMLLRYARTQFADPDQAGSSSERNADLTLLLNSVAPLFVSLNNGVVASAIAVFFHLATRDEFCNCAVKPLVRLISQRDDGGQAVALQIACAVAIHFPHVLIPYVSEFYVSPAHSAPIRKLRMKLLMTICAAAGRPGGIGSKPEARRALLAELKDYLFRTDKHLAAAAARAIGCLATAHQGSTPAIVRVLSSVVASADSPAVVSESIGVLRRLLQRHPSAQAKALPQLIAMLLAADGADKNAMPIREPAARASIIWLIGEFYEKVHPVATEALRVLARGFTQEASEVKLQILNLAAKVVAWNDATEANNLMPDIGMSPSHIRRRLLDYVVSCARYDRDYDVRDKARMLHFLFLSKTDSPLLRTARTALLSKKPVSEASEGKTLGDEVDDNLDPDVVIGSMAHVLTGRRLFGFRPLEPWADADSDATLREESGIPATLNNPTKQDVSSMSSSNFPGGMSSVSSVNWHSMQGVSSTPGPMSTGMSAGSSTNASSASAVGRRGIESGAAGMNFMPGASGMTQPMTRGGSKVVDVDPETFYGSDDDDEDSDDDEEEETDEDEEEDDEEDTVIPHGGTSRTKAAPAADLLFADQFTSKKANGVDGTAKKAPSSEFDLEALLGGLTVDTPKPSTHIMPMSSLGTSPLSLPDTHDRSEWHKLLEPWNAGGLEIDTAYVRVISPSGPAVSVAVLRISNRGKVELSDIQLKSECGENFKPLQPVPSIPPGESREVIIQARFNGKTSGVKFAVEVGGSATGHGEFKPSVGFVVRPNPGISPGGFLEAEKSLTGMFATEANIKLPLPAHSDWMSLSARIKDKIIGVCYVSHIKTSVGGMSGDTMERFSTVFAGWLPSAMDATPKDRPVLIRATVKTEGPDAKCTCVLWIGCEDVLFSANLMRLCRNALITLQS